MDPEDGNVTHLALVSVVKSCINCGGFVRTSATKTPLCAACRAKGLCLTEELEELRRQITPQTEDQE